MYCSQWAGNMRWLTDALRGGGPSGRQDSLGRKVARLETMWVEPHLLRGTRSCAMCLSETPTQGARGIFGNEE